MAWALMEESLKAVLGKVAEDISWDINGNMVLGEDLRQKIADLFEEMDADGSGSIDKSEMGDALRVKFGIPVPADDLVKMIEAADTDNNGSIEAEEFEDGARARDGEGGVSKRV